MWQNGREDKTEVKHMYQTMKGGVQHFCEMKGET